MRIHRFAAAVTGAGAIAVAALACRQLVGIDDEPPGGPASPAADSGADAGFTYGQGACAACVATKCATQSTACAGNASCSALEGCMSAASGDPTHRAECGVDHGLGNDGATPAFEACLASACATECGLTCGGLAAVFPPATAPACEQCIATGSECASATACAVDPECQTRIRCQFSSSTLDVQQACGATLDGGPSSGILGANAPVAGACSTDCSWGADWSCIGKVSWPAGNTGQVATTVFVYASSNGAPIDGATVKLCNTSEPGCVPPLAGPLTTDGTGTVVLQRPPVAGPQLFFVDVSSPAITPTITFDVFPISEPQVTIPFITVPQGVLPSLANLAGVTLDPTLGMILVGATDCRLAPAPGVTFDLEPKGTSTLAYVVGSLPVVGATATDSSGTGVFANTAANVTLELTVTSPRGPSTTTPVFARAGALSTVYALPTSPP